MNKHWIKLLVVTVIAVLLALWVQAGRNPQSTDENHGAKLIPELKSEVNAVQQLRIVGPGDQTLVTLKKGESTWTVLEKDGYEADLDKVREYLLRLADASLIESKTANPELYERLGVGDVAGSDAKGLRIELEGMKKPVKLIVGNFNGQGGPSTFVRRNDEAKSWLVKGSLVPEKLAANWVQKALSDIPSSRIQRVEITWNGKKVVARKDTAADANYQIDDVPKGRELNTAFEGNGPASVLAGLRFEDVRKADPESLNATTATVSTRLQTFDGVVVTAISAYIGDKTWVEYSATLDPVIAEASILVSQAQAAKDYEASKQAAQEAAAQAAADAQKKDVEVAAAPEQPLAMTDPAKDKTERMQALQDEVSALNLRFKGWQFVLPPYTYSNMSRKMEELLKPEKAES